MVKTQSSLELVVSSNSEFDIGLMVKTLGITRRELASAAGLPRDALTKASQRSARVTQMRLHDFVEILRQVQEWAGSGAQAYAWYRAQPLPSFGDKTAENLVKDGKVEALKTHLSRIKTGGYA